MQSKTDEARSLLCCPTCHASLNWSPEAATCESCSVNYPIESGVVRFIDVVDEFYEGFNLSQTQFVESENEGIGGKLKSWVFFNLVQSGIAGEIRRACGVGARVLDIGSAGGIRWLGETRIAIGVDLSLSSLQLASRAYAEALQASITELPVRDNSVDCVFSGYTWEHLDSATKEALLREIARVLRRGGRLVVQTETLGDNPLIRYAQHDPEKYKKGFIENDGHIGLEPGSKLLDRLSDSGFKIERVLKINTTVIQYPSTFGWLDLSYGDDVKWVRKLGDAVRWTSDKRIGLPIELAITAFDRAINPFTKIDAATRLVVTAARS